MTSMEQIELISVEARKRGMKYGEYVEKYGHTLPKPKPTKRKAIEYYSGKAKRTYQPRTQKERICEMCGVSFMAGTSTARWCPKCRRERSKAQTKEGKQRRRKTEKEKETNGQRNKKKDLRGILRQKQKTGGHLTGVRI